MNGFLIVLAFIPGLFGYGSKQEAEKACYKWIEKGVIHDYPYTDPDFNVTITAKEYARTCFHEPETNQYLGFEYEEVKKAKEWFQDKKGGKRNVVKRFRY